MNGIKRTLMCGVILAGMSGIACAETGSGLSNIFTIDNRDGEEFRITSLRSTYIGVFAEGVDVINTITAEVDWDDKTPSRVVFNLNGADTEVVTGGNSAQTIYNMGCDLEYSRSGAKNELIAYAVADDGAVSQQYSLSLWGLELPQWAISMESKKGPINYKIESTGKLTFYGEVEVLKGGAGGTINIPKSIPEIGGKWGVEINPLNFEWELSAQPRFGDGAGLTGLFGLGGKWGAEASCGSKRKGEISATLSGDGEFYPELKLTDVSAELAGSFTFLFPRVPLLCQWTGCCHTGYCPYFQASIAPEVSGTVGMEEGEPAIVAGLKFKNAELNIGVTVAGTVGAGSEGSIYYIAGTIGGKPYIVLQFPPDSGNCCVNEYIKQVAFDLEAKFVVECGWWKIEEEWVFNIYTCPETGGMYALGTPSDEKQIVLVEREYLDAPEGYCVFPDTKGGLGILAVGGLPDPILNVGTMPTPSVAATSNEGLLLFTYDDAGKPTGKHQEIYYARWNGSNWTSHAPLTDNLNPDSFPVAAIDTSGKEIAVWMSAPEPDGLETGPRDVLPGFEITFSKYDTVGEVWAAPQDITANSYADLLPWFETLPTDDLRVCWIASATNSIPVWHDEEISPLLDMMAADWNGSTFGSPYVVASDLVTTSPPSVCRTATHEFLAYIEDTDYNSATADDRQVAARAREIGGVWGTDEQLTTDPNSYTAVQMATDSTDTPLAVWVRKMVSTTLPDETETSVDQLWFARWNGSDWDSPELAIETDGIAEPKLIKNEAGKLILFWVSVSEEFSDIYYSVYDADLQAWGDPQQITHDQGAETMISLTESGGNILAGYVKRRIDLSDPNEPPVIGASDIYLLEHVPEKDLSVSTDDISFDPYPVTRSASCVVSADIHLSGDFTVEDVLVRFYDGDPGDSGILIDSQTISSMLPGQVALASASWQDPNDGQSHSIYVVVDPDDTIPETDDITNNKASVILFKPDLRATNLSVIGYPGSDTVLVGFSVRNDGDADSEAFACEVRKDSETGDVVFTSQIGSLDSGTSTSSQFTWDVAGETPGICTLVVIADSDDQVDEANDDNNTTSGQVPVLPDLQAEPWSPQLDGTTASVTVRNTGAKPSSSNVARVTYEGQTLGEETVSSLDPGDSVDVIVSLSQTVGSGRVDMTVNPDSDGSDEVSLLNNTASVLVFASADFEPDRDVDMDDMTVLLAEWLKTIGPLTADIAPEPIDGIVNLLDFAELAKYWLEEIEY